MRSRPPQETAGERRIDAAELERVFPAAVARTPQSDLTHIATHTAQLTSSQEKTALLERTNEDLCQRLDASEAERGNVQTQLSAPLFATPVTPINQPRPLGRRILAWLARQHGWCCVKKVQERHAVREMKEDPS